MRIGYEISTDFSGASALNHRKIPIAYENQEMERVPRVNGCFRLTKGNFGRE